LASANQRYNPTDVERLVEKLEDFRRNLETEQQRELLDHLIAGAESLFTREAKEEVIVLEKNFKEAAVSALKPFINSNRGKHECYFWIRH
jgi:hypothetical protein